MTDKTPKQLALEATAAAKKVLIATHEDEFRAIQRREYEARGLEFPQTPEEKALDDLQKLLTRQPDVLVLAAQKGVLAPSQGVLAVPTGKKVKDATHLKGAPGITDVPLPDSPNDGVDDDIDLPPDHGITPPGQNPEDPWSAPAPGTVNT